MEYFCRLNGKLIQILATIKIHMPQSEERENLLQRIQALPKGAFTEIALDVFRYQARFNPLYKKYLELLDVDPMEIKRLKSVPFLPIEFFKSFSIQTGNWDPALTFHSSGTTGMQTSKHLVRDPLFYQQHAQKLFEYHYGPLSDYCLLALLPAYLEREGSSLVYMVDHFIKQTKHPASGFFLYNMKELVEVAQKELKKGQKVLVIGVSFALIDLGEQFPRSLKGATIMETGGMKGRRREFTRPELHQLLTEGLGVETIHSEYGMTELLSQAYSPGNGRFLPSATMGVMIRELNDPFYHLPHGRIGAVNVIDLANLDTCSFIATDDLGRAYPDYSFEIMGRADNSDIRGCNLMIQEV